MKRRISRREIAYLVSGLCIGLLVGAVLVGSNHDLRTSLFGSAASDDTRRADDFRDYAYYLVDLPTAEEWLAAQVPDSSAELAATLETIARLPSSPNFRQDFRAVQPDVGRLLPQIAQALDPSAPPESSPAGEAALAACLGLDDDPYRSQPTLYLYVTISASRIDQIDVPATWERLEKPKANALFWQLLACYPAPDSELVP
jgi:hypothetical protein